MCNGDTVSGRGQGPGGTMQRSAVQQAGTTVNYHAFSSIYRIVDKTLHRGERKKGRKSKRVRTPFVGHVPHYPYHAVLCSVSQSTSTYVPVTPGAISCSISTLTYVIVVPRAVPLHNRHLLALKCILRYLRVTTNARLTVGAGTTSSFSSSSDLPIIDIRGWFDASWADNPDDSRSTFGYTILYGQTALLWKSMKHKVVTLSTTDAEYLAATELIRDICFLQNLFADLKIPFKT